MPKSNILDQPSLAVVVDCWKNANYENYHDTMVNIREFCTTNQQVESVALTTYRSNDPVTNEPVPNDRVFVDQPWWNNGRDFFYNETKWDFFRRIWDSKINDPETHTYDIVANMPLRSNQIGFVAFDTTHILYYCNFINPGIRNLYFCGGAWEMCLRHRPTGWMQVQTLNYHKMFHQPVNILVKNSCVVGLPESPYVKITDPWWIPVGDDVYMLDQNSTDFY